MRHHTDSNLKYREEMLKTKFVGHTFSSEKPKIVLFGKKLNSAKVAGNWQHSLTSQALNITAP
jgi:hypothetical protein